MVALRCCSFNCRGWNSGSVFLKDYLDSFDLCFVQEHWLHSDHLNQINSINLIFSRLVLVVWIVGLCFVGVLMVVLQSYIENLMLHVLHRFHLVLNAFVVLKFSILVDYHICWSLYTCLLHVIRLLLLTILIHLESYKGSWSLNNVMLIFWLVISMWILIVAALWLGYYVISWARWVCMLVIYLFIAQ